MQNNSMISMAKYSLFIMTRFGPKFSFSRDPVLRRPVHTF